MTLTWKQNNERCWMAEDGGATWWIYAHAPGVMELEYDHVEFDVPEKRGTFATLAEAQAAVLLPPPEIASAPPHPAVAALLAELEIAERKANDSLARYKFQMFGYWAAIWVHLNRIGGFKRPNPWRDLVTSRRNGGKPCS